MKFSSADELPLQECCIPPGTKIVVEVVTSSAPKEITPPAMIKPRTVSAEDIEYFGDLSMTEDMESPHYVPDAFHLLLHEQYAIGQHLKKKDSCPSKFEPSQSTCTPST